MTSVVYAIGQGCSARTWQSICAGVLVQSMRPLSFLSRGARLAWDESCTSGTAVPASMWSSTGRIIEAPSRRQADFQLAGRLFRADRRFFHGEDRAGVELRLDLEDGDAGLRVRR